jgi:hypothetical protein
MLGRSSFSGPLEVCRGPSAQGAWSMRDEPGQRARATAAKGTREPRKTGARGPAGGGAAVLAGRWPADLSATTRARSSDGGLLCETSPSAGTRMRLAQGTGAAMVRDEKRERNPRAAETGPWRRRAGHGRPRRALGERWGGDATSPGRRRHRGTALRHVVGARRVGDRGVGPAPAPAPRARKSPQGPSPGTVPLARRPPIGLREGPRVDPRPYLERVRRSDAAGKFLDPERRELDPADVDYAARLDVVDFALQARTEAGQLVLRPTRPAA